jgi:hypothetical protein
MTTKPDPKLAGGPVIDCPTANQCLMCSESSTTVKGHVTEPDQIADETAYCMVYGPVSIPIPIEPPEGADQIGLDGDQWCGSVNVPGTIPSSCGDPRTLAVWVSYYVGEDTEWRRATQAFRVATDDGDTCDCDGGGGESKKG